MLGSELKNGRPLGVAHKSLWSLDIFVRNKYGSFPLTLMSTTRADFTDRRINAVFMSQGKVYIYKGTCSGDKASREISKMPRR